MKLTDFITQIDEPNQAGCLRLLEKYHDRIAAAPGSMVKHQAWEGGYVDHLVEAMEIAVDLYEVMNQKRPLSFTLSDVILILFLHDLEKPYRYVEPKQEFSSDEEKEQFIIDLAKESDIVLNEEQHKGLKYIHGEGKDYSRTERVQTPLAAFVHICDTVSARIWFDEPKRD